MNRLDKLREISEKATDGPWVCDEFKDSIMLKSTILMDSGEIIPVPIDCIAHMQSSNQPNWKQDCEYIAAFDPPTVKALLDVVEIAGMFIESTKNETGNPNYFRVKLNEALKPFTEEFGDE
jgi:hypothetical protein